MPARPSGKGRMEEVKKLIYIVQIIDSFRTSRKYTFYSHSKEQIFVCFEVSNGWLFLEYYEILIKCVCVCVCT